MLVRRPASLAASAALLLLTLPLVVAGCGSSDAPALTAYPGGADSLPPVGQADTVYNPAPAARGNSRPTASP